MAIRGHRDGRYVGFEYDADMSITEKLKSLNITLAPVPGPFGTYVPARRSGNLVFVAGQIPRREGKIIATGPVPSKCSVELAREAARQCVINGLSAAATLGADTLDNIAGVVRVGAFVNSDDSFIEQSKVADAGSELLIQIFGDAGKHARVAVGTNTLPQAASVEIEFVFEMR
ncbi:MAG TPA: RidA family protein [Tepidisphaeraceae bacterium]|jgi:enamine deaminase RidA (YjgF/YER057c/UK114 family)